jgi:hypothetical protein
MIYLSTNLVQY